MTSYFLPALVRHYLPLCFNIRLPIPTHDPSLCAPFFVDQISERGRFCHSVGVEKPRIFVTQSCAFAIEEANKPSEKSPNAESFFLVVVVVVVVVVVFVVVCRL